ncbi:hypothetical protein, partial [Nocardiopsis rhodophaea]
PGPPKPKRTLAPSNTAIIERTEHLIRSGEIDRACKEIAEELADPIYDRHYPAVLRLGQRLERSGGDLDRFIDDVMGEGAMIWSRAGICGGDEARREALGMAEWLLGVLPDDAAVRPEIATVVEKSRRRLGLT